MSIRSSIPRSRLLTTLNSPTPVAASTLVPPYSHSQAIPQEPSPSLRPPYAHQTPVEGEKKVQSKLRYALLDRSPEKKEVEERYLAWASGLGEEQVKKLWLETLTGLQKSGGLGTRVPEISFHQLSQQLAAKSTVKDLKKIGIVLVRDVVLDADAQAAGEEVRSYIQARGQDSYWHEYLLALRAHTSLLSANSQIMSALTGKEAKYVRANTLTGLPESRAQTIRFDKPWTSHSIHTHLVLSPSRVGAYRVTPSIHAARYGALRPLFKPRQSRISFYNKEGYLDPSNWIATTPRYTAEPINDLPHLTDSIDLPELRAGDIIYSHSALPFVAAKPGTGVSDFLPVSPLSPSAAREISEQREAYEQGLPPPHVLVDGSIALENAGNGQALSSNGGRTAMGY